MNWTHITKKARLLAESSGLQYYKPEAHRTELRKLACELGADRIELRRMDIDAFSVQRQDERFTVFLNDSQGRMRHRFSLAHEIAHILLWPMVGEHLSHRNAFAPDQDYRSMRLESLCNEMASSILMPEPAVLSITGDPCVSARSVPIIAQRFDVSFEAAARRFLKLTPIPCAMLMWRPDPHGRFLPLQSAACNAGISMHSVALATPPGRLLQASRALRASEMVVSSEFVELVYRRGRSSSVGHLPDAKVESLGCGTGQYRRIFSFVYMSAKTSTFDQTS